ncbi:MAG: hypothetical protein G01um101420_720 [Parcubacteria group bacterium Gr01-1014_20]|nr:MAG: hypothetical protein G01um101420_720 [Parcubacteria group bacterium Gr01-1014_20]
MSGKIMVLIGICFVALLFVSSTASAGSELFFLLSQPQPKAGAVTWTPVDTKLAASAWNAQMPFAAFVGDGSSAFASTTVLNDGDWSAMIGAVRANGLTLGSDAILKPRKSDYPLAVILYAVTALTLIVVAVYYGIHTRTEENESLPEAS